MPDGAVQDRTTVSELLVQQCAWEAEGVMSLRLIDPDGAELPGWQPGAHVDVILPSGKMRQYSLCGLPSDRRSYTIAVLREESGRGGSREIHDQPLLGRSVGVRGPRNHFPLVEAEHSVLFAGGIGITPILSMARQLAAEGRSYTLVYGGRSRRTMAFLDRLPEPHRVAVVPEDELGLPDLDMHLSVAQPGTQVFCCGPEGLLRAVEDRCVELGLPLQLEQFTSGGDKRTERAWQPGATGTSTEPDAGESGGGSFKVELHRSGLVVEVPAHRSVLDAVREQVGVLSSCEEGYCGSCETRVLDGEPDHRDTVLLPDERASNETMMICVSRSRSNLLVLDL